MEQYRLNHTAEEVDELLASVSEKTIYPAASGTRDGLMSAADKNKLDNMSPMRRVTYEELLEMRNNGLLIKGALYCIMDYQCTTKQTNTKAADHSFGIIVRADAQDTINENAYAMKTGDTYFSNCNLAAWELKYCLDNDTSRFAWADEREGKGVIYYMKDEWGNECPYDFKNILFERVKITYDEFVPSLAGLYTEKNGQLHVDEKNVFYVYTFCMIDSSYGESHDVSVEQDVYPNEAGRYDKTCNNHIKSCVYPYENEFTGQIRIMNVLSDNVFVTDTEICNIEEDYGEYVSFEGNCLEGTCMYNTFGNGCRNNTFGDGCRNNTLGDGCRDNTLGRDCFDISAGAGFAFNSLGNECFANKFGDDCWRNKIGDNCSYNQFVAMCSNNTMENDCSRISFSLRATNCTFKTGCGNLRLLSEHTPASDLSFTNIIFLNGTTGDIYPPEREQGETTIIAGNIDGGGVRFIDIINDFPV